MTATIATARLDWYGCATYRLTLPVPGPRGTPDTVVFLDAYVDRVPAAAGPRPAVVADDIDRADWIVIGHSHFDHLWGAERIARRTGATIIGSHETVRVMEGEGVPLEQLLPVAGGERIRLADGVIVSVYPSLHSCVWSHQAMHQADEVCLGDLFVTYDERQLRFAELGRHLASLGEETLAHLRASAQGPRGDGHTLVYVFDTPEGSLLFQDTSGHWSGILRDLRPDVAIIAAAGRANVDGEPIQGSLAHFVARQASLLRPRRVILSHHDDWLPGFSIATDVAPIREELQRWLPGADLADVGYLDAFEVFAGLSR
jgi:L-ascorbate metabolism protein UlaG (beta-lactamase superfamily)